MAPKKDTGCAAQTRVGGGALAAAAQRPAAAQKPWLMLPAPRAAAPPPRRLLQGLRREAGGVRHRWAAGGGRWCCAGAGGGAPSRATRRAVAGCAACVRGKARRHGAPTVPRRCEGAVRATHDGSRVRRGHQAGNPGGGCGRCKLHVRRASAGAGACAAQGIGPARHCARVTTRCVRACAADTSNAFCLLERVRRTGHSAGGARHALRVARVGVPVCGPAGGAGGAR